MASRKTTEPQGAPRVGAQSRVPALLDQMEPTCAYCRATILNDPEAMRQHVLQCPQHPAHAFSLALGRIQSLANNASFAKEDQWLKALDDISDIAEEALAWSTKIKSLPKPPSKT